MSEYLHGAYARFQAAGSRVSEMTQNVIVYIGTAPVHLIENGGANVNKPILVQNIAEARKFFGYSEDYASYTLCEAMHVHFELNGVGPLVFINVLDPVEKHVNAEKTTVSLTPSNGFVTVANAENMVIDSIEVKSGSATKVRNTDYSVAYNAAKKTVTINEMTPGALGSTALSISYKTVDPSKVNALDVIGASDGVGLNTGIFAVKNVYQETGFIPSFLMAPGFSSMPAVHAAMVQNSQKINGHWDAYMLVDLPITTEDGTLALNAAKAWKDANGYNRDNETVYYPMAVGTDGAHYHLSVLAAANFQKLMMDQSGIPYRTASNTPCTIIKNLYVGEENARRVYDDDLINEMLCKNGIASAAFIGGHWVIWGCHSADYSVNNGDDINVSETNRMMLYYISNDFQHRRTNDVDKPLSRNDIATIIPKSRPAWTLW